MLSDTSPNSWYAGLHAFYRLVGCVFYKKCAKFFCADLNQGASRNPSAYQVYKHYEGLNEGQNEYCILLLWLDGIRKKAKLVTSENTEEYFLPSADALRLHWQRACWVTQYWKQCDQNHVNYADVLEWGWENYIDSDGTQLVVKWDSEENRRKVNQYHKLWSKGCHCLTSRPLCGSKRCSCFNRGKPCGPSCDCAHNMCSNQPEDPSIPALLEQLYPLHEEDLVDAPEAINFVTLEEVNTDDEFSDDDLARNLGEVLLS